MSKNYNRCSEENKETDKYGMTDKTNENVKTQKKKIVMALTAMTRAAPTVTAIKTDNKKTVCPGICHRDRPVHKRLRMCGRWNVCIR